MGNTYKEMKTSEQIDILYSHIDSKWFGLGEVNPDGEVRLDLSGRHVNLILEALVSLKRQYIEVEMFATSQDAREAFLDNEY